MKDYEAQLYQAYLEETEQSGGSTKHVKYGLKIYFTYCAEIDLDARRVTIRDAQNFQVYLTTRTTEDNTMRFSRASIQNIVGCVTMFYEFLRKKKFIASNPFTEVDCLRREKSLPRNIFNEGTMHIFLNHLKNFNQGRTLIERRQLYRAHVIAELMYATGARINEIAKLTAADIDCIRSTVLLHDSKTGKKREAILGSFAEKVLSLYMSEMRDYVLTEKSKPATGLLFGGGSNLKSWLNTILNNESQKLKLGTFTSHNFRHALGYHLLRGGCDIRFIQEIMGHVALHTTQVYTKVDKEDLRRVLDTFHPRVLHRSEEHENA
jgi:integrase/recombinase XerC